MTRIRKEIHTTLIDLVRRYGSQLTDQLLAEQGLSPQDVTEEMLATAKDEVRREITRAFRARTVRLECLPIGASFQIPHTGDRGIGQVLDSNASICKIALTIGGKTETREWSPATEVVPMSRPSDNLCETEGSRTQNKEKTVQVDEQELRQLLRAMGKPEKKWTRARLLVKLEKDRFTEILKDATEPTEQADLDLLNSITDALKEGETIVLKEEEVQEVVESQAAPEFQEVVVMENNGESTAKKGKKVRASKEKKGSKAKAKAKAEKPEGNDQGTGKKGKKSKKPSKASEVTEKTSPRSKDGMSGLEAAVKVLQEAGKPMNRREIMEAILEKGYWHSPKGKTPEDTLKAAMLTEIHKKGKHSRFKKAGKGLFAARG